MMRGVWREYLPLIPAALCNETSAYKRRVKLHVPNYATLAHVYDANR